VAIIEARLAAALFLHIHLSVNPYVRCLKRVEERESNKSIFPRITIVIQVNLSKLLY